MSEERLSTRRAMLGATAVGVVGAAALEHAAPAAAADINAAHRRLYSVKGLFEPTTTPAGNYFLTEHGVVVDAGGSGVSALAALQFDAADHAVDTKSTVLGLRGVIFTNDTSSGVTFEMSLVKAAAYSSTNPRGGAGRVDMSIDATPVVIISDATNLKWVSFGHNARQSQGWGTATAPTGMSYYYVMVNVSGTMAANSAVVLRATVDVWNV